MNYQKIILVGNAVDDAQHRLSKKGDVAYTTFRVGVSDHKDQSTYFSVSVFGKYGETLAEHITKGRELLVEGRINVGDKGYFNVVADKVRLGVAPTGEPKSTESTESPAPLEEFMATESDEDAQETK
jgi:single-stranded DNA-binding protein